ncbi:MAG: hypothetical protein ACFB0E_03460 [Leptolyngbyaceae cyanobacterium]
MKAIQSPPEPATVVISEVVKPRAIAAYEEWCRDISRAAQHFDGFLGVEIIRPRDIYHPEYKESIFGSHYPRSILKA